MTNRKTWIDALASTSAYSVEETVEIAHEIEKNTVLFVKWKMVKLPLTFTISFALVAPSLRARPYRDDTNNFNLFLMYIGSVALLLLYTLLMCWLTATACPYGMCECDYQLENGMTFSSPLPTCLRVWCYYYYYYYWWCLVATLRLCIKNLSNWFAATNEWSPFGLWLFHFSCLSVRAAAYMCVQWKGPFFLRIKLIL